MVLDVDGTLTDGTYQVFDDGAFSKTFHTRDFDALTRMLGIVYVVIMTTSHDEVILKQVKRLQEASSIAKIWKQNNLIVINKSGRKIEVLEGLLKEKKFNWENVAYIGDAHNDIECMKKAIWTGCPSDAIAEVRENSNYISDFSGGKGAVYDFCMYIYNKNDMENR